MQQLFYEIKPKGISRNEKILLNLFPLLSSTDNDGVLETTIFYKVMNGKVYILREKTKFL